MQLGGKRRRWAGDKTPRNALWWHLACGRRVLSAASCCGRCSLFKKRTPGVRHRTLYFPLQLASLRHIAAAGHYLLRRYLKRWRFSVTVLAVVYGSERPPAPPTRTATESPLEPPDVSGSHRALRTAPVPGTSPSLGERGGRCRGPVHADAQASLPVEEASPRD